MPFLTDEEFEAEAIALRKRLDIIAGPLLWRDLEPRIERGFPGLRVLSVPDEEMTYAAAEADAANKRIRIRQTAYDRLRQNCPWALETLVHELSHFHLEHTGIHHRRAGEIIRAGTPMTRRTLTF